MPALRQKAKSRSEHVAEPSERLLCVTLSIVVGSRPDRHVSDKFEFPYENCIQNFSNRSETVKMLLYTFRYHTPTLRNCISATSLRLPSRQEDISVPLALRCCLMYCSSRPVIASRYRPARHFPYIPFYLLMSAHFSVLRVSGFPTKCALYAR